MILLEIFFRKCFLTMKIDSQDERTRLGKLITENGGVYDSSLRKSSTHLITPSGAGRKVEGAIKWKQEVVDPRWVEDCLKRNARLEERYYSLSVAKEKRGLNAFGSLPDPDASLLPEHYFDENLTTVTKSKLKARKKNDNVWQEVIDTLPKERPAQQKKNVSEWDNTYFVRGEMDEEEKKDQEKKRKAAEQEEHEVKRRKKAIEEERSVIDLTTGIFDNIVFAFLGYKPQQVKQLTTIVVSHNGTTSADVHAPEVTHLVVNSMADPDQVNLQLQGLSSSVIVATEWFIERSLFQKEFICDVWGTFVSYRKIPELQNLSISISGFTGVELLHVEKLIRLLGAKFEPTFTPNQQVLISKPKSSKFDYALKWRVPIVSADWLWECAKTGTSVPLSAEWVLDEVNRDGTVLIGKLPEEEPTEKPKSHCIEATEEIGVEPIKKKRITTAVNGGLADIITSRLAATISQENGRRFVGKAKISSTSGNNSLHQSSFGSEPVTRGEDVVATQISYLDQDSLKDRQTIMNMLGAHYYAEESAPIEETRPLQDANPNRTSRRKPSGRNI